MVQTDLKNKLKLANNLNGKTEENRRNSGLFLHRPVKNGYDKIRQKGKIHTTSS
jgi:hypothetical protein